MNIRYVKLIIAGVALSVFIFLLVDCAPIATIPTELRNMPIEVRSNISPGDTREKVYSVLGKPLIDAIKLGAQVYQNSDSDIQFDLFFPFFPHGMSAVYMLTVVTYDENELVKDLKIGLWYSNSPDELDLYLDGFSFLGISTNRPDTLLGPPVSSRELVKSSVPDKGCTLIVLFSECSMAKISLDKVRIIDLVFTPYYCRPGLDQSELRNHEYYGTYIKKEIDKGVHKIEMSKGRWDKKFESNFECKHGEIIYTEFKAHGCEKVPWHGIEPIGKISVYKSFPESSIEGDTWQPILWHEGKWYGPPGILRE